MTILLAGLIGLAISFTTTYSSKKAVENYKEEQKIVKQNNDQNKEVINEQRND